MTTIEHAAILTSAALCQDRWFYQHSRVDITKAISALPIFEVAADPARNASKTSAEAGVYTTIQSTELHLVPSNAPIDGTLTSKCVIPASDSERNILTRHFKLCSWTLAEFYRLASVEPYPCSCDCRGMGG